MGAPIPPMISIVPSKGLGRVQAIVNVEGLIRGTKQPLKEFTQSVPPGQGVRRLRGAPRRSWRPPGT